MQGGCKFRTSNQVPIVECVAIFSPAGCKSFAGTLALSTVRTEGQPVYNGPQFQKHLENIGLGAITAIGALYISVIQTTAFPADIALSIFPQLSFVQYGTTIIECVGESPEGGACVDGSAPVTPHLTGVDFQRTQYLGPSLVLGSTGFVNMKSFRGLRCPPVVMTIVGNPFLTSLDGLESILPWSSNIRWVSIAECPGLATPGSVAALSPLVQCTGATSTLTGVYIGLRACTVLSP